MQRTKPVGRHCEHHAATWTGHALSDLPPEIREENPLELMIKACNRCFAEGKMSFDEVVTCLEKNLIRGALKEATGNRSHAARILGMNLSTLRDKLKKYNLPDEA